MLAAPDIVGFAHALGVVVLPELVLGKLVGTLPLLVNGAKNPESRRSLVRIYAFRIENEGKSIHLLLSLVLVGVVAIRALGAVVVCHCGCGSKGDKRK